MPNADPRVALPDGERQYHIALGPGELAEYILLPGDQDRIERIATRLTDIEMRQRHREFASITGASTDDASRPSRPASAPTTWRSCWPRSWLSLTHPTFIRIGSCGVLQDDIELGDLVVTTGAVRLESTTSFFVHDGYPAVADYGAVAALVEAAHRLGHTVHTGITATAPGFYGAQGRPIPQLPIRFPDLAAEMRDQRVINFEMEASALLVLAGLAGCRAGVVCTAYAQRASGRFVQGKQKDRAEAACIDTGLEALCLLAEMDEAVTAAGARHWRPSLWAPMAS